MRACTRFCSESGMALAVHEVFIVFCSDWLADGKYDVILQNANEPNPNGVLVGVITLENMSEYKRCKPPWLPAA
jgi:hypothetical protein